MQMGNYPLLEDLGILNSLTKPFLTSSHVGDGSQPSQKTMLTSSTVL